MKWSEMSVFYKSVFISVCLCGFAAFVVVLCSVGGVLPGLYENPLFITLFGIVWLGQAILNWKKQRVLAIFNLITALICLCGSLLWIAHKLIIR